MRVHIGKIIKSTLKAKEMDVTEFSKKISYTRGNVYKIFNKASIDTDLLVKISTVLNENLFFKYISEQEIVEHKNDKLKPLEVLSALKDLKSTMIELNERSGAKKPKKKIIKKRK